MDIIVDKRTELMSIVLSLCQGNEYIKEHFTFNAKDHYREAVIQHFSKFENHRCVNLCKEVAANCLGFNFDNPIRLAFALNENLQFCGKIEKYLIDELENESLIKDFLLSLQEFAFDSEFNNFYNKNKNYYQSKTNEIANLFESGNFICVLEKFLKRKVCEKFQVNVIPMLINANHGFEISGVNIANIGLPSENIKTIEPFNKGYMHIIIHEICHCFVNCNTENYKLNIDEKYKEKLASLGYKNPIAHLNDTIVRAMTIFLREKIDNIDVKKFLDRERSFGFIYVEDVYNKLHQYQMQTLCWEQYFPEILSCINCTNNIEKTFGNNRLIYMDR